MPTVVELERLRALVERLLPLASVQRGDVIRADNWNLVVESLIEMARTLTALQTDQDVPSHEHISEVSLDWLDAELRQLIERGPLNDPIATSRVLKIEQRATELSDSLASVGRTLGGLRERLDETITRDLVREHSMVKVTQKVDGIADGREDVLALRRTLDSIRKDTASVLELRENLLIDGRPISMKTFNERMKALEEMRDRLRLPNGQVLDGVLFEQRLQTVENRFVPRDELDDILGGRKVELSDNDFERIQGSIRVQFSHDLEKMSKEFDERMRLEFNSRFADVEKIVAGVVAGSIPSLRDSLSESLRSDLLSVVDSRTKGLQSDFDKKLTQLRSDLELRVDRGFNDVQAELKLIRAEIPPIRSQVENMTITTSAMASDLEKRLTAERAAMENTIDARLTAERVAADKRTQDALLRSEKGVVDQSRTLVIGEVNGAMRNLETNFNAAIARSEKDLMQKTSDLVTKEVAGGIRNLEAGIDTKIQDGVKRGVASQVEGIVDSAVGKRMAEVEKGLRATITDEVKRQIGDTRTIAQPTTTGSDFTKIPGIGAAFDERLKGNGIQTYADLAAMKPAQLAKLLSRTDAEAEAMIKEAARLARVR